MGFVRALRLPQIALLWSGQVFSAMGDYLYTIAVLWIAVRTSGSGAGFVAGAQALATFIFGLPGGVYADRWNRRRVMITVDLLRAAAVLLLPWLALTGRLQFWHFVAVAVVVGGLGALFNPALQASVPALSGGDVSVVQAANGLMDITRRLARTLGPALAGLLVAFLPLAHFFTLDAVSFAVSALTVCALGSRFAWQPAPARDARGRGIRALLREALDGIRLVRAHQPLYWSLIALTLSNVVWSIAFVIGVPLLVTHGVGGSVGVYALIVSAYGVGNVLGNVLIGSLRIRRRLFTIFLGQGILGLGFLLLACASSVPLALFASALAAFGGPLGDIMILTMLQVDLPADGIGKGYSVMMILENVGVSLGLLAAVPFFHLVSVPIGIALCALLLLVVSALGLLRFGREQAETTTPATVASGAIEAQGRLSPGPRGGG